MYTEQSLLHAMKHKEVEAFHFLYDTYAPLLYGVFVQNNKDALFCDELLQEVFLKAWKDFGRYDPVRGRLFTWMLHLASSIANQPAGYAGSIHISTVQQQ